MPDGLTSISKMFAHDTSLLSNVFHINESANDRNVDLEKISRWVYQWKMKFNPDPNKQTNAVISSQKSNTLPPLSLHFKLNNVSITKCSYQRHLGFFLDSKLNFNSHVAQKIKKCNKIIGLIKRVSITLPDNVLLTIYKCFKRPHLDHGDILYDNPNNENFQSKLEKVQCRACLAISGKQLQEKGFIMS